jgi:hypothetical protein
MGYAILKGEGSFKEKIQELFTSRTHSRRRVVLGPLAALEPSDYFPDIRDVEFYSWGQESLPDRAPLTILAERGVRINWVNPMHLRLYWVKGKGAVIGPGLRASSLLAEFDPEMPSDLALYLDAGALMAVDEVLGPLLLEPTASDTFSDLQESCNLLWLLAEGITAAVPVPASSAGVSQNPAIRTPYPAPETEESPLSLESQRKASDLKSWYDFLEEEAKGPEGLLCFYDRPRSRRVQYFSQFFAGLGMLFGI